MFKLFKKTFATPYIRIYKDDGTYIQQDISLWLNNKTLNKNQWSYNIQSGKIDKKGDNDFWGILRYGLNDFVTVEVGYYDLKGKSQERNRYQERTYGVYLSSPPIKFPFWANINWYEDTEKNDGRPLEYIKSIIATPYREIFIAERGGETAGLAEVMVTQNQPFPVKLDMKWVALDNLVVSEKFKGHGIGSMLIDCVIDWARDWNINRIELKVYEQNFEALSFYEAKGFETLNRTMFLNIE